MASKKITIDTGEWAYPDSSGITHPVTNAENFTFTLTDTSSTVVVYNLDTGQSVVTDDGYTLEIQPQVDGNNTVINFGTLADTQDAATIHNIAGAMPIRCSVDGVVQIWKPAVFSVNNVDAPTTATIKWEDQFGNTFDWTTVTVGAA